MATAKKYPEFELPALLLETIKSYMGAAKMSQLTPTQRMRIADVANACAQGIGKELEATSKIQPIKREAGRVD